MTDKKLRISKKFISLILIIAIIFGTLFSVFCCYWHRNHKLLYHVYSITAYQYENNPNLYRVEIKGSVKAWFFDNNKYKDVEIAGPTSGGEPKFWSACASSEKIDISRKRTKFTIKYDIDSTTSNNFYIFGENDEYTDDEKTYSDYSEKEYIYSEFFTPYSENEDYDLDYSLYMNDFRYIPVKWTESKTVTDSLLETE